MPSSSAIDRLLGLVDARANLLGLGNKTAEEAGKGVDYYLEMELGEPPDGFPGLKLRGAKGKDPAKSANKAAIRFLADCSKTEPDYLYPHETRTVPGAADARAFVLGPPRDIDKIDDLDPIGDENFGDDDGHGFGAASDGGASSGPRPPFAQRHVLPFAQMFKDARHGKFFAEHYGNGTVEDLADGEPIADAAEWRRMTPDDAAEAAQLALAMNNATNNASLVLAFELGKGGKVLLFVGDAQAGNWRSWDEADFDDAGDPVTTRDLLERTVLYKVGHHGSHNATLNGKPDSKHANLNWMATGNGADEFAAMITAVEDWAHQKPKPDWNHPLPAIKDALVLKAGGRVLQTDSAIPSGPSGKGAAGWQSFLGRVTETPLYFDIVVEG